ncbi:MAG TPA: FecR domain-containing protein, partial [Chitinophagaceae bacterium]
MPMSRLEYLFSLHVSKTISPAEREELAALVDDPANDAVLQQLIAREMDAPAELVPLPGEASLAILATILRTPVPQQATVIPLKTPIYRWRYAAAAVVLLLLATSGWFLFRHTTTKDLATTNAKQTPTQDVAAPLSAKATITLASGQKIILDSAGNGMLATQGNIKIEKLADGQIAYNTAHKSSTPVMYNTLTNPRGSKVVSLTLTDGSRVWLNAESSLRYPTTFNGNQRTVEITGEAYFEVAHNAAMPFTVKKANEDWAVRVLGTHFNINAYDDETATKITLLEGSVKVTKGTASNLLRPGEQAVILSMSRSDNTTLSKVEGKEVDLQAVMAWKNGLFNF